MDTSKVNDDDIMDIDDNASVSSDSNHAPNNTSVTSASDNGKVENITPTAKKLTPTRLLKKKQESAKKQEERLKRKQVNCKVMLFFVAEIFEINFDLFTGKRKSQRRKTTTKTVGKRTKEKC